MAKVDDELCWLFNSIQKIAKITMMSDVVLSQQVKQHISHTLHKISKKSNMNNCSVTLITSCCKIMGENLR